MWAEERWGGLGPTRDVYFPTHGFISLVTLVEGSPGVEIGMVGREGMLGAQHALGVAEAPWRALVQGQGVAWRTDAATFKRELALSPALQPAPVTPPTCEPTRNCWVKTVFQACQRARVYECLHAPGQGS